MRFQQRRRQDDVILNRRIPIAAHFNEIDADHKGYVTLDEIEQYLAQHRR